MNEVPFWHDHLVLDTSVIIKWYRQGEALALQALLLRSAYLAGDAAVSAPSLLVYELSNVLRYKNDLRTDQVQAAVQSLLDMNLQLTPPSGPVMQQAVELARRYGTTVYDAVFAALAQALPAVFITADTRLAGQMSGLPFVRPLADVTLPEEENK